MHIVVLITVANIEEANLISEALVKQQLCACVNMVKGLDSIFLWNGSLDRADEILLVAKSHDSKFDEIVSCVKAIHSYECPEIICMPIVAGSKEYLEWIDASVNIAKK
ncbi:MAG: CutA1 divalent ion tolerance protein [candidate division TM6 bacterium GW2011_GWE2_41_16]|nr:MAG: CutA1 divalent ion tolerance protein [candidate division TM6 bacterium GW2011_GWE2_41_16]